MCKKLADVAAVLVTHKDLHVSWYQARKYRYQGYHIRKNTVTTLMIPNNHIFEVAYLNALASPHAVNEIVFQGLYFQLMPLKYSRGFKEESVHCGQPLMCGHKHLGCVSLCGDFQSNIGQKDY